MQTQTILTLIIILCSVAYLAVYFMPRRKRVRAGGGCGACKGELGCCAMSNMAQTKQHLRK